MAVGTSKKSRRGLVTSYSYSLDKELGPLIKCLASRMLV
jgi:hypothetical protein